MAGKRIALCYTVHIREAGQLTQKGFLIETEASTEMPDANRIAVPDISYVRPLIEEHEAVREVTAGTDDYSSCSSGHYWYPN